MPTGQHWYVSVRVAKGGTPGERGVLTSGVHGDEMSSVHTVQAVIARTMSRSGATDNERSCLGRKRKDGFATVSGLERSLRRSKVVGTLG